MCVVEYNNFYKDFGKGLIKYARASCARSYVEQFRFALSKHIFKGTPSAI